MLPYVAVGTGAAGVFRHQALFAVLAGDDVDDARYGIAAVKGAGGSLYDFYAVNVVRVDEAQVVLATVVAVQSPTVNEYEHIGIAQAVHLQMRTHVVLVEVERGRQSSEDVLDALAGILLQLAVADNLGLYGGILQQVLRAGARHHDFLQTVGTPDCRLRLGRHQ